MALCVALSLVSIKALGRLKYIIVMYLEDVLRKRVGSSGNIGQYQS